MNALLILVSVVLPLLPVVLFPTRFIGRGIGSTLVGAALIVGMMMLIYLGLNGLTGLGGSATAGAAPASADASALGLSDADLSALEQVL